MIEVVLTIVLSLPESGKGHYVICHLIIVIIVDWKCALMILYVQLHSRIWELSLYFFVSG